MQEWSLPRDPQELAVVVVIVVALVVVTWVTIKDALKGWGFLPPDREKAPKPGKLTKIVSSSLQAFVASLPRPAGDPLADTCQPIPPGAVPLYEGYGYIDALLPLWKSQAGYSVAMRTSAKRHKERTEFVRLGDKPGTYDIRAFTEQGFLADTMIDVMATLDWSNEMTAADRARRAAATLGFKYLDETVRWYRGWRATDWSKPLKEEEDDEDMTPEERAALRRDDYVSGIDKRESSAKSQG